MYVTLRAVPNDVERNRWGGQEPEKSPKTGRLERRLSDGHSGVRIVSAYPRPEISDQSGEDLWRDILEFCAGRIVSGDFVEDLFGFAAV